MCTSDLSLYTRLSRIHYLWKAICAWKEYVLHFCLKNTTFMWNGSKCSSWIGLWNINSYYINLKISERGFFWGLISAKSNTFLANVERDAWLPSANMFRLTIIEEWPPKNLALFVSKRVPNFLNSFINQALLTALLQSRETGIKNLSIRGIVWKTPLEISRTLGVYTKKVDDSFCWHSFSWWYCLFLC